jgi:CheY-like chemotaxis protein
MSNLPMNVADVWTVRITLVIDYAAAPKGRGLTGTVCDNVAGEAIAMPEEVLLPDARYRALLRATRQIAWTAQADGAMGEASGWCAFTGQTMNQASRWGWLEAVHPEDQARVREGWLQAPAGLGAASRGIEGTGIGLALSKQLVEAMDGAIGVESVAGEGSTFWVELPLSRSTPFAPHARLPAGRIPELVTAVASDLSAALHTVLYVEDNLSNVALVEHLLIGIGQIRLLTAMQGSLGIELARRHLPDMILLDLHLPDMQGDEVLRRLRADPITRDIPVVVLSADARPSTAARLRDAGAVAYLTKPLDVKQFLATLQAILTAGTG